mgnify:CR=1 FL=1
MTPEDRILVDSIYNDNTSSGWVKNSIIPLLKRDPVDALNDVEYLLLILNSRFKTILKRSQTNDKETF